MFRKKTPPPAKSTDLRYNAQNRSQFNFYSSQQQHPDKDDKGVGFQKTSFKHGLRLVPSILALGVIGISVLMSLTLTSKPRVSTVNNQASPYRSLEDYAVAADKLLSQDLRNKTKLTINTDKIETELRTQFPELGAAVLRLPIIGRQMNLVLSIDQPVLILATPTSSYVLDSTGTAVSDTNSINPDILSRLTVVKDQSGLKIELGKQVITKETVTFIAEVIAQLKDKNITISSLTLPTSANQLDIRTKDSAYYIKTDVAGSARLQMGSFLAVKEELERTGKTAAEYIDVRVEEKVFYK